MIAFFSLRAVESVDPWEKIEIDAVTRALKEDLGRAGDLARHTAPPHRAAGAHLRRISREHGNIVAARDQPPDERLADESGSSGDNDLHTGGL